MSKSFAPHINALRPLALTALVFTAERFPYPLTMASVGYLPREMLALWNFVISEPYVPS